MATITTIPTLSITQNNNGTSTLTTTFSVAFNAFDKTSNQPYSVRWSVIGDDTNVGDPASAGADDVFAGWIFGGTIQASDPNYHLTYTLNLPTTWLNEDQAPASNSSDEIRVVVTLYPEPAKAVSAESVLVQLAL
jgi:hypothetical protein